MKSLNPEPYRSLMDPLKELLKALGILLTLRGFGVSGGSGVAGQSANEELGSFGVCVLRR